MRELFRKIDEDKKHWVRVIFSNGFDLTQKEQFKGIGTSKDKPTGASFEWNPNLARLNNNGTKNSPAMIFGHELDHAVRWINDPAGYRRDTKPDAFGSYHQYGNFEERRVIKGSETHAAITLRQFGEGIRNDGAGRPFRVESPTFDTPQ
jgi:hypothetical protein